MYYTVIKHEGNVEIFYISQVFSYAWSVLSQCNTQGPVKIFSINALNIVPLLIQIVCFGVSLKKYNIIIKLLKESA